MSYNRECMLIDCINEILSYEEDNIEVVISDNASTDGTWEELCEIEDKRVHIYQNEKNMGMAYNLIRALTLGNGKYVMPMTDRDRINMSELRKFVKTLDNIDKEIIIAKGVRYLKSDFATYRKRVYEYCRDGQHPGWWIYSGKLMRRVKNALGIYFFEGDEVFIQKTGEYMRQLICQSDKWFCYCGDPIVILVPHEKLKTIESHRTSYFGKIFWGLEVREHVFRTIIEQTDVKGKRLTVFIEGVYAGNINRVFNEYYNVVHDLNLCERYNYVPPKHIWWFRDGLVFLYKCRQYLKKRGKLSKEIEKFLLCETLNQYISFTKSRIKRCFSKIKKRIRT